MYVTDGDEKKNKLSMLFGVTLPCILSIFSVILFLRLGMIVGQVKCYSTYYVTGCEIFCLAGPRNCIITSFIVANDVITKLESDLIGEVVPRD